MLCPACKDENLSMTDRQGIEIDYCPRCRGIWLDRGELDRIIERSERDAAAAPAAAAARPGQEDQARHRGDRDHHDSRPRREKSLLGELFDF
ncbi:MAG: zf-TFIIB domain-containing protein [Pseudomonadota bacterium]|nr:zf-TFIIB domain-containing protein [Pseudomonadota bacterium]